ARLQQPHDLRSQAALFKAIQQGTQERGARPSEAARQWAEKLANNLLASKSNDDLLAGAELAGSLQMKSSETALAGLCIKKKLPEPQRRAAIDALRAINPKGQIQLFGEILEDASEALPVREHVALVLAGINSPEANAELVKSLTVAPARLQNAIANGMAGSPQGAEKLL